MALNRNSRPSTVSMRSQGPWRGSMQQVKVPQSSERKVPVWAEGRPVPATRRISGSSSRTSREAMSSRSTVKAEP